MTLIGTFRHYSRPLTRALVVLFTVSWLGLAVQPCVAASADHSGAPAPAMPAGGAHDCPNCPPPAVDPGDCGMVVAIDCAALGTAVPATQPLKGLDMQVPVGLPPSPLYLLLAEPARSGPPPLPDPGRHVAPCTLQQRYCSYLK